MAPLHVPGTDGTIMRIAARRQLAILPPALLVAMLAVSCTSADAPASATSFYAEIAVAVGPEPDDPLARVAATGHRSVIRWWHSADPVRWRWEIETTAPVIDAGVVLTVFDGDDVWEYDDRTATYRRRELAYAPRGEATLAAWSAPVGPAHAASVEAFIARWRERGDAPGADLIGEATLLGRRTEVVELRPAAGGAVRVFIDPERMFIMRWAAEGGGGGQAYHAEVTTLDYDAELDASRFAFQPPPGAREAPAPQAQSCSSASGPLGGAAFPAQPGFLRPAYVPAGYHSTAAGSKDSASDGCGPVAVWALLEGPGGAYILLRQRLRPGGVPRVARSWQPAGSSLEEAFRRSEDGVLSLLWRDDDIVAVLETDSVSLDELLAIAESASLVPAATR